MARKSSRETSVDLARRYQRELQDLVDLGEISRSTAQSALDDMLEPEVEGRARRVRLQVWLEHEREAAAEAARPRGLKERAEQLVERVVRLLR